ncbi:hypothetical protein FQN57_007113 [Myotisia sp. PD_48]|nr:hypothetical protein FQN57_007113 [Myotisia sp. PD_48]
MLSGHQLEAMESEKNQLGSEESVNTPQTSQLETSQSVPRRDRDQAYDFLEKFAKTNNDDGTSGASPLDLRKIRRKVDWYIIPVMFLCYTMQFVDKVSLNYAAVMGLPKDLKLKNNNFSNAATAFFIAYLIAEVPTAYVLNKVAAPKWLGINVILWGISTACTAAAKDYKTLLAARIFLGIFEAAVAPCLVLISSQWYTKSEQAPRFSLWYSGLGLGQIIGGLVSYGFQQVIIPSFTGWKIMFVVLGAVTVVVGIATILIIPNTPMEARFLSDQEKAALLKHVSVNQTGVMNKTFKWSHIIEILTDVQLWLMTLITILISISSGVVTTYSATLIRNFGYSGPVSALLNMPAGIVSIVCTMSVGFTVRYHSFRFIWLVACCIPGILGGALLSFMPANNHAALLAGIYLVNAIVPTLIILYQWLSSNVAGSTKRAVSAALLTASFSVGNIIGPQTFQAKDAPQFIPAKIAVLATQAAGAVVTVVLFLYYVWANRRKDKVRAEQNLTIISEKEDAPSDSSSTEENGWDNLTDKENLRFRYVY